LLSWFHGFKPSAAGGSRVQGDSVKDKPRKLRTAGKSLIAEKVDVNGCSI
jgi:hypothetical protein